jgi:hypothetical protein
MQNHLQRLNVSQMELEFPVQIAEKVFKQWETFCLMPDYQPAARPPQPVLETLLSTCFFASLNREEGRTIEFELALCSQSHLGDAANRFSQFTKIFNLIRLEKSPDDELSVHELVKLAPACDPDKTILLVENEKEKNRLKLWGVADVNWQSGTSFRLNELRIRVVGPGEMRITLHDRELCSYKNGHIIEPERVLINTGPIYSFFKEISLRLCREVKAATGQGEDEEQINERDYRAISYFFALQKAIEGIQQLKHGGCILIVPEGSTIQFFENLNVKYRCRDETVWNCLRGQGILHDKFYRASELARGGECNAEELVSLQSERNDVEHGLRDALAAVVRFTAVDGAVLLTRKFELLGFGAVVKLSQTATYQVFRCKDRQGTKREAIKIEDYGTRHRSAFEFCRGYGENSVAIVVSQDGGVKIVRRVGDHVYFWENMTFDLSNEM